MLLYPATATFPPERTYIPLVRDRAALDRFGVHALTDDPARADIILFLDVNEHGKDVSLSKICTHPLAQEYREKTFLYNELDQPWCAMQGIYVSMPKGSFQRSRQRACAYLLQEFNPYVGCANTGEADLLFSFAGRDCHPIRRELLRLEHPRALMTNTRDRLAFADNLSAGSGGQKRWYADLLHRSKFVLCPRGAGTSSFRLFETMATGRVPVIIADDWVPPQGPNWEQCSMIVKQADIRQIPQLLTAAESRSEAMGAAARKEWEGWFSPSVQFHRMVEACASIRQLDRLPEAVLGRIPSARYLRLRLRAAKAALVGRARTRWEATRQTIK